MYIRSQNKIFLGKVEAVNIHQTISSKMWQINGIIGHDNFFLGEYQDEERAKRVVDDIQAHIVNYDRFVYNMPKE